MTQHRRKPGALSNFFDRVLSGIGKRGSSFSDLDAVSHDKDTKRFLVQEFKQRDEPALSDGQYWMLRGLAEIPSHFTVWLVRRVDDDHVIWANATSRDERRRLTIAEYRALFHAWWYEEPIVATTVGEVWHGDDPDMAAFVDAIREDAEKKAS